MFERRAIALCAVPIIVALWASVASAGSGQGQSPYAGRGVVSFTPGSTAEGESWLGGTYPHPVVCRQESYSRRVRLCQFSFSVEAASKSPEQQMVSTPSSIEIVYDDESGKSAQINAVNPDISPDFIRTDYRFFDGKMNDVHKYKWNYIFTYKCDYSSENADAYGRLRFSNVNFDDPVEAQFILKCASLRPEEIRAQIESEQKTRAKAAADQADARRRASPSYRAHDAAKQVRLAQMYIDAAERALSNERSIGAVSGYIDMMKMHRVGEQVVYYRRLQSAQWKIYKANGGPAPNIASLLKSSLR